MERYKDLIEAAKKAQHEGDTRLVADKFLEVTLAAPSKWDEQRSQYFLAYVTMLSDPQSRLVTTPEERKSLKRISKDESEPILFRSEALYARGVHSMIGDDFEDAAMYFRRALKLIPTASASERGRRVRLELNENEHDRLVPFPVGDLLDVLVTRINNNMEILEDPEEVDKAILDGVPKRNGEPDPEIVRRLTVGGGKCDCCGKKWTAEKDIFQRCTRCKRAYYCPPPCQVRQWNAGHKKDCREPGQIKPGDYMTLKGLKSKPELNSKLVRVVGPADTLGRWGVSVPGLPNTISVAPEKLVHIRPAT